MRSKLSIRRKISVFSIDYDIQSKPLANIDMIAVIFHPLGLNPFVRCAMSELYNHFSAEKGSAGIVCKEYPHFLFILKNVIL